MSEHIDALVGIAADAASRAAADFIRLNGLKVPDYDVASQCLRAEVKLALPQALQDAKEAMECHMSHVAQATFRASMAEAGIKAAKEFGVAG